jgi:phage-related protein
MVSSQINLNNQESMIVVLIVLRESKISLKSSFFRDFYAQSGSLFHESCVSPITLSISVLLQDLRKISLKSSFFRDFYAQSGSLFHESCVSPITLSISVLLQDLRKISLKSSKDSKLSHQKNVNADFFSEQVFSLFHRPVNI